MLKGDSLAIIGRVAAGIFGQNPMFDVLSRLFDPSGFVPRWTCGDWTPVLGYLHIVSDIIIGIAYVLIPLTLWTIIRGKSREVPTQYQAVLWLFVSFIFLCGTTHFIDAMLFYHPLYRLDGVVKLFTALVSVITVVALARIVPKILQATSREHLERLVTERTSELEHVNIQLRRANLRLSRLWDASNVGMITCTITGEITDANNAFLELTGYTREDVASGSLRWDKLTPEEYHHVDEQVIADLKATGKSKPFTKEYYHKDGTRIPLLLMTAVTESDETISVVIDRSRQHKLERELQTKVERLAEADKAKDRFLATLGHELRNPLAPVMNTVYTLRRYPADVDAVTNGIDMIERQVIYRTRLVDDLMDLSRIQGNKFRLNPQRVEINGVVRRCIGSLRPMIEMRYHKLSVYYHPNEVYVHVDPTRIEQVINNLITNAIKYTDAGGKIWISVDCNAKECIVKVRDNGSGIDAELMPHIFAMFTQGERVLEKSQGGLGIGLSLVKTIVEMSGGSVEAHSEGQGHGSEFIIRLPASNAAEPKKKDDDSAERKALPMKILVIDDNVDGAESLGMLMRSYGHRTKVMNDGSRILEVVKSFKPEAVLLDIGLPGRDGYEICTMLRDEGYEDLIIIAITGYGQESDRIKSQAAGFDSHMVKPVDPDALRRALTDLKHKNSA